MSWDRWFRAVLSTPVLILASLHSAPAPAQSAQAAKLAGLPVTIHVVVVVDSAATAAGVSADTVRDALEARLRDAGFAVSSLYGGSYLMAEVHAFGVSNTGMLVYDVGLEYHAFAIPMRRLADLVNAHRDDKQVPAAEVERAMIGSVDVSLYRRAVYGVGGRNQGTAVTGVATRSLQVFIDDFRSVNPR